jgi:hypothetical protein
MRDVTNRMILYVIAELVLLLMMCNFLTRHIT